MSILKTLYYYLKYKYEIDNLYGYMTRHGADYGTYVDEDANWKQRTNYWFKSE
jgi:hypothetical protein